MALESPMAERYVVYSVDKEGDVSGAEENHILVKDVDYPVLKDMPISSDRESYDPSLKIQPYWYCKGRCCCLWNFFVIIALSALCTVVILAHNRVIDIRFDIFEAINHEEALASGATVGNSTKKGAGQVNIQICTSADCVRLGSRILVNMKQQRGPLHGEYTRFHGTIRDFYQFSCGGYIERTKLSWNVPRKRLAVEDLVARQHLSVIDRLSTPIEASDSDLIKFVKATYRSCIFRPTSHDARQMAPVRVAIQEMFGTSFYTMDGTADLTDLLSTVVKNYGASPLFKLIVTRDRQITIINRYSDTRVVNLAASGVDITNFRFLQPSDFYYRNVRTDKNCYTQNFQVMTSYRKTVFALVTYLFGEPPEAGIIEDILNLEIQINKAWYYEEATNYSGSLVDCTSPLRLDQLGVAYSGYGVSWRTFFNNIFSSNDTRGFVLCNVNLSADLSRVIQNTDKKTLLRYIMVNAILTSDVYDVLPIGVPRFQTDRKRRDQLLFEGTERHCAYKVTYYVPSLLIINSGSELKNKERTTSSVFRILKKSYIKMFRKLYWIPKRQRDLIMKPFLDIDMRWQHTNNSLLTSYLGGLSATENFFQNIHRLIRTHNAVLLQLGNVDLPSAQMSEQSQIDMSTDKMHAPIYYHTSRRAIVYGSLGSFVAQAMSHGFNIDDLLSQYTKGIIDHRVVFTFAFKLQCLVEWYNQYTLFNESGTSRHVSTHLNKSGSSLHTSTHLNGSIKSRHVLTQTSMST
ncbi:hypothetical protein ScPMuIL_004852 [Solemya velum]